ncbi:hypothetical protein [Coprococcus comes]|uniref:hypothetical protein n=1 Tax=Coprococcus comes TaxID=410072 RepID=UPI001FAD3E52|nr:hypothetical protein [Coprococcus comes]
MKKTLDIKKLVLLNMPYILLGLFATNFGEAWRMAQKDSAKKECGKGDLIWETLLLRK